MESSLETLFDLKEENALTQGLSESALFCVRAKRRAIRLANALLDEEGKLVQLDEMISLLEKQGYILEPHSYTDSDINNHFLQVLHELKKNAKLTQRLQRFALPLCSKPLNELIAITLDVEEK